MPGLNGRGPASRGAAGHGNLVGNVDGHATAWRDSGGGAWPGCRPRRPWILCFDAPHGPLSLKPSRPSSAKCVACIAAVRERVGKLRGRCAPRAAAGCGLRQSHDVPPGFPPTPTRPPLTQRHEHGLSHWHPSENSAACGLCIRRGWPVGGSGEHAARPQAGSGRQQKRLCGRRPPA